MTISARPAAAPPRDYHFPRYERTILENGLVLLVAPVHKLPVVSVSIVMDAGSMTEPTGKDGVAQLTARALLEGTTRLTGTELSERLELLGASVDATSDWDSTMIGTTLLAPRLGEALNIMGEVVREPAFPEREIERLKSERLAELLQLRAEPRGLADEMFGRFLYDETSRYARPEHGSGDSIAALNQEHVTRFYRERYAPDSMTVVVAGDVGVTEAVKLLRHVFGDWKPAKPPRATVVDRPARLDRAVHIVRKEGAPQSELRIGHVGLPRRHPDYFPALVMNSILGGLFSSRINLNLREAHGYTYGASSAFEWRRASGPFVVSTAVKSDVTDAAAREILSEIERLREELVGKDELSLATSYLAGIFPIRFETTEAIARALAVLAVYELPDDYFDSYRVNITRVSGEDVLRAARTYLRPEQLQILAVGDDATIREPLVGMQFGPVAVHDAEADPERTEVSGTRSSM